MAGKIPFSTEPMFAVGTLGAVLPSVWGTTMAPHDPIDQIVIEHPNAEVTSLDLSGGVIRAANLFGARIRDAMLVNARIDAAIDGLEINGIEIAPLIEAELDRRDPDRVLLRSDDPEDLRRAWSIVQRRWAGTIESARADGESVACTRVDGEWSLVETLRHLVFVTDAWLSRVVLGEARPYHRFGLPPTFLPDLTRLGIEADADPGLDEVLDARTQQAALVDRVLADLDRDALDRVCAANPAPGYPPQTTVTLGRAVRTVLAEEWAHHGFAARDLTTLGLTPGQSQL